MIKNFTCKQTEKLFCGERCPSKFRTIQAQAERKLQMLDTATSLAFLRSPPGNRLEALQGNREGHYSIRINNQWRICFMFVDGDCHNVEIVDYH
jgi:toxin HigB-1